MVLITEELVRKKAEHNECLIGTLEELSLHQEDIEKIEHLHNWCKNLRILYLQANIISKIENLYKLKNLEYLNLALNNIEKINNLEGLESLKKLDLTMNFIGNIKSICKLQHNENLRSLYLVGNPCAQYEEYRTYVVHQLPQLTSLDSIEITRSERLKAEQKSEIAISNVKEAWKKYKEFRANQIERMKKMNYDQLTDEEYWQTNSENCPETRVEMVRRARRNKNSNEPQQEKSKLSSVRLFNKEGRPLNINQAKLKFTIIDWQIEGYIMNIEVYKHIDSNLLDLKIHPIYATLTIKDKIFQYVFPEEINVNISFARRSKTTGHLEITLYKANYKFNKFRKLKKQNAHATAAFASKYLMSERDSTPANNSMDIDDFTPNNTNIPPLELP